MRRFDDLIEQIRFKHQDGEYHIKRGFSLKDAKPSQASNHLIEEAVELQAEVLDGPKENQIEEAADVLLVYLHLLHLMNLNVDEIVDYASKKLKRNFTKDKSKILTKTPGYTRSNRENENACCAHDIGLQHPNKR